MHGIVIHRRVGQVADLLAADRHGGLYGLGMGEALPQGAEAGREEVLSLLVLLFVRRPVAKGDLGQIDMQLGEKMQQADTVVETEAFQRLLVKLVNPFL